MLRFAAVAVAALLLHVGLGWEWTLLAGVAAGLLFERRAWLAGASAVGLDWLLLVLYNYYVDASAVARMTTALGDILGNMPSGAVVAITLLIGAALGGIGALTGSQLRRILRRPETRNKTRAREAGD